MRHLYLNPFHGGSHAAVAEGYSHHSQNDITLLSLSIAGGWRWRMRGAAITLARKLREHMQEQKTGFDIIITTDMLDLATFLGLTRDLTAGIPVALYMHENQLTYPLPAGRARDLAFPWINYTSMLAADAILFNSAFHRRALLDALPSLPGRYFDHHERDLIDAIAAKSHVLPPGIDLARLDPTMDKETRRQGDKEAGRHGDEIKPQASSIMQHPFTPSSLHPFTPASPVILWNSRWEYDKGPEAFFAALKALEARGVDFRVIVAGEHVDPNEPNFLAAREWLGSRALAWGYAPDIASYRAMLWQADIVVSTAIQEFFGISVIEAMYCGCVPMLPRRLSYPDLLPAEHHAACLYDDAANLVDQLHAAIRDLPALKQRDFRSVAAQYDWSHMAARYDAAFAALARVSG